MVELLTSPVHCALWRCYIEKSKEVIQVFQVKAHMQTIK